jgi:hypothetical protein
MTNHDDYLAEYQRKFDALPFWERVRIKISLFINGVIYWRVANILWWLFRYDLFDGRFVNNLEPDPQCDDEYAAGQYEEYNNIDDFIASFEDDK